MPVGRISSHGPVKYGDLNKIRDTRQLWNTDNARLHWYSSCFPSATVVSWLRVNRRQTACNVTLLWRRTHRPKKTGPDISYHCVSSPLFFSISLLKGYSNNDDVYGRPDLHSFSIHQKNRYNCQNSNTRRKCST